MIEYVRTVLFSTIDARQFAVLRLFVGCMLIVYLSSLSQFAELHYSANGWLSGTEQIEYFNAGNWSLFFVLNSLESTRLIFVSAIIAAFGFMIGFKTRLCGMIAYVLLVSIWNRNPFILDGDDALLRVMLFYLIMSGCGHVWSVDARFKVMPQSVEIWPLRLMQCQMALLYFVSGWVKLHSPEWLDGTIFNQVLIHPEYSRWNLKALLQYQWIQSLLPYFSRFIMYWEVFFPVLILHAITHKMTLIIGVIFHLGLLIFMNLRGFSIIMLGMYLVFLPNRFFVTENSANICLIIKRVVTFSFKKSQT